MRAGPEFGDGPLSRAVAAVYTLLVVEALLLATTAPGLVALLLLDRDAGNAPLAALCALPVGPALSAALYAMHHRGRDVTDLRPAAAFWRGYRTNLRDSLRVWAPYLAWLTVVALGLGVAGAPGGAPAWWSTLLVLVSVAAALWLANALVISSLFAFRGVDVARLAAYFLVRTPGVTLGTAGLLVAAVAVTVLSSEGVLALLGSLLAAALVRTARPMIAMVRQEFTA